MQKLKQRQDGDRDVHCCVLKCMKRYVKRNMFTANGNHGIVDCLKLIMRKH